VGLKILLVGIEASVCELISRALEDRGHHVTERVVWDSQGLMTDAMNVDLVICEVSSDSDAEQPMIVLQKLRLPVIAISRQPVTFRRYTRQPWAYLTKPLRIRQLIELAEEAGTGRS